MNFLAHLFLSYPSEEEMTGNFIGDFVKGKQFEAYPPSIRLGIKLHRLIDEFTDNHTSYREIASLFKPSFKRYSGVVADIALDHFLAQNWSQYHEESLDIFAGKCYEFLMIRREKLPERMQVILPKIVASRRLQSYHSLHKTADAIDLMASFRSFYFNKSTFISIVENERGSINAHFKVFFQEVRRYVIVQRDVLSETY